MDSDGDEMFLSPAETSPIQQRRLKRLKKPGVSTAEEQEKPAPENPSRQNSSYSFERDFTKARKTLVLENSSGSLEGDRLGFQDTLDLCKLWDSGPSDAGDDRFGTQKSSDLEENAHLERSDPAVESFGEVNAEIDGPGKDSKVGQSGKKPSTSEGIESVGTKNGDIDGSVKGSKARKYGKKRGSSEETEEKKKKKKKARKEDGNTNSEVSARSQKRLEKERKAYLEKLHADSQRLLRETRDASFKPVQIVQKPVSSVLEKIRLRKLEVQKKIGIRAAVSSESFDHPTFMDASSREPTGNLGLEHAGSDGNGLVDSEEEGRAVHNENAESSALDLSAKEGSVVPEILADRCENVISDMAPDTETTGVFRPPLNDTEDLYGDSQLGPEEDQLEHPYKITQDEDVLTPSLLTMDLKLDSAPMDDDVSDEEYDDKENIDPRPKKAADMSLYPKGDPVKAFVDDEAEEEDDSDNDRMRFEDNEEDEDDDNEELRDLIVTGEGEMPIDCEKRDQLHQKWLEEQDAAATDNVMQRLKCGWKPRETSLLGDEEDEEDLGEDPVDDLGDLVSARVVRVSAKKVKQMIATMYTDREDAFVSSDDEEMDQKVERERLLRQTEENKGTFFLSPAEDENSKEVFCRIKKLNIAPDSKKRAKPAPSFFDSLIGVNSDSSSKSSFLGRTASNSMQSNHKQGSGVQFRSFIFGRDDSNSRSALSAPDLSSDADKENQPAKNASSKSSFSQIKSKRIRQDTVIEADSNSGSSLFDILKSSSVHSNNSLSNTNLHRQSQVINQFAAFKSAKKVIRMEKKTLS